MKRLIYIEMLIHDHNHPAHTGTNSKTPPHAKRSTARPDAATKACVHRPYIQSPESLISPEIFQRSGRKRRAGRSHVGRRVGPGRRSRVPARGAGDVEPVAHGPDADADTAKQQDEQDHDEEDGEVFLHCGGCVSVPSSFVRFPLPLLSFLVSRPVKTVGAAAGGARLGAARANGAVGGLEEERTKGGVLAAW